MSGGPGGGGGVASAGMAALPVALEETWSQIMFGAGSLAKPGDASEASHADLGWDDSFLGTLQAAIDDGSPFAAAYSYDPTADLGEAESRYDDYDTFIDALDPDADWGTHFDAAKTKVDELTVDSTEIATWVDEFEERLEPRKVRAMNRFAGGMFDINAVVGSAFVMGLAAVENEKTRTVGEFDARISSIAYHERGPLVIQAVAEMGRALMFKAESERLATVVFADLKRVNILAQKEYLEEELGIATQDAAWELEMWQYGGNLLSSLAGTAVVTKPMTRRQSQITGAMTGLSLAIPMAAATGSLGIGAVIAAAGLFGGAWMGGEFA